jgi:hypothetical protein
VQIVSKSAVNVFQVASRRGERGLRREERGRGSEEMERGFRIAPDKNGAILNRKTALLRLFSRRYFLSS